MAHPKLSAEELKARGSWKAKKRQTEERELREHAITAGIRAAFSEFGMTSEQAAERAGVDFAKVRRFLNGELTALSLIDADAIAKAFNLCVCIEDGSPNG